MSEKNIPYFLNGPLLLKYNHGKQVIFCDHADPLAAAFLLSFQVDFYNILCRSRRREVITF